MRFRDSLPDLREAIAAAAAACGASSVRLFGSVARGEERDDSDVDFLVRLEAGRTLLDLVRLETRLEDLLVDCFANNNSRIFDAEPQRTRRDAELIRLAQSSTLSPYT